MENKITGIEVTGVSPEFGMATFTFCDQFGRRTAKLFAEVSGGRKEWFGRNGFIATLFLSGERGIHHIKADGVNDYGETTHKAFVSAALEAGWKCLGMDPFDGLPAST